MDLLIKNGTIVTATEMYKADIAVDKEKIVNIGCNFNESDFDEVVDASGKLVLPGAIDGHTHLALEFGGTISTDDYYAGTRSAAWAELQQYSTSLTRQKVKRWLMPSREEKPSHAMMWQ